MSAPAGRSTKTTSAPGLSPASGCYARPGPVMPTPSRPRLSRAAGLLAVAVFGVALLLVAPTGGPDAGLGPLGPAAVRAAAVCTGWTSETEPPATIRVLRTTGPNAGTVAVVPFRDYVNVVMTAEWGPSNPTEALRAGAVAVKEYGWVRAMTWRGKSADDGSCYDVADSTVDQVYGPETHDPAGTLTAAVDATWSVTALRSGHLFATHYEGGANVACAVDADGRRLFQNSAMRCARDGMAMAAILGAYYFPDVEIVGAAGGSSTPAPTPPGSPSPSPTAPASVTVALAADHATVTWGASIRLTARLASDGPAPVVGRTLHLERSADGVTWVPVADLTTDASGTAVRTERPAANSVYRARFDGAADFAAADGPTVAVTVRRLAILQPGAAAGTRRVARGAAVWFGTLVRPTRGSGAAGPVEYRLLRLEGRTWVVTRSWTVTPDAAGRARTRVTFSSRGSWIVRSRAVGTSANGGSTWSAGPRYVVS